MLSGLLQGLQLRCIHRKARDKEDAMDTKYTEVPGAMLVTMMVVCWLAMLLAGAIGAIFA